MQRANRKLPAERGGKVNRQARPFRGDRKAMTSLWNLGGLTWRELGLRVWRELGEDAILGRSAQLSFYFLLSMFPFLLFLMMSLGYLLEEGPSIRETLVHYLSVVAPRSTPGLIDMTLRQVTQGARGGKLSLGLLIALWAASSGVVAIGNALNVAYEIRESRPWWKQHLVAMGLTIALLVLMMTAFILVTYGRALAHAIAVRQGLGPSFTVLWTVLQWPAALTFVLLTFNLVYLYAPNVKHRHWTWLMPGTVVGVVLWLVASFGFKAYLSVFNTYSATYGSMATIVIMLLWFFLSGIALLVGGEVNSEIERALRSRESAQERGAD